MAKHVRKIVVHANLYIEVYKQTFLFLIDEDYDRGHAFIEQQAKASVQPVDVIISENTNAAAFSLDSDVTHTRIFVVWMKFWDHDVRSIARLSHEVLHSTIHVLNYIGYCPRLKPRTSEPVCYLFDYMLRLCLNEIPTHAR